MVVTGKEKTLTRGGRRSGASARFDGIGVECKAGKEDAKYFPSLVEK